LNLFKWGTIAHQKEITKNLDKCIKLNPSEPVFYYVKGEMNYAALQHGLIFGSLDSNEALVLEKAVYANVQRAVEIDPSWEEPKSLLEDTKKLQLRFSHC